MNPIYNESYHNEKLVYFTEIVRRQGSDVQYFLPHLKNTDDVLDVGCGSGAVTLGISKYVKNVIGFDFSKEMIARAKLNAKKIDASNVEFVVDDMYTFQFSKKFNVIILANSVILEVRNSDAIIAFLKHLSTQLLPGGKILITMTPLMTSKLTGQYRPRTFVDETTGGNFSIHYEGTADLLESVWNSELVIEDHLKNEVMRFPIKWDLMTRREMYLFFKLSDLQVEKEIEFDTLSGFRLFIAHR